MRNRSVLAVPCAPGVYTGSMRRILPLCMVLALGLGACTGSRTAPAQAPAPSAKRALRAVLFPYIPDAGGDSFAKLIKHLESGFEETHPAIDLRIVMDLKMDLYDLEQGGLLSKLFGNGADAADVVEIDTMLLGALVERGFVQPVGVQPAELEPILDVAWRAVTVAGAVYGVPTYLCSNVIYANHPGIVDVDRAEELIPFLRTRNPDAVPLVANYAGSWTLGPDYVDAWADTHGNDPDQVAAAYRVPLDPATMQVFAPLVRACAADGKNPCLDDTYKDNTKAEEVFAQGKANAFLGYSERLFFILSSNRALPLPTPISAPLGAGSQPMIFVDALAVSAQCQGQCLADAQALTAYLSSAKVRTLIAFSQDAPAGTPPRYLLQANERFYSMAPAREDPVYQGIFTRVIQRGQPFPNQGFPKVRTALDAALMQALGGK